jgi:glycerol-3-phosphate dehydrogenase
MSEATTEQPTTEAEPQKQGDPAADAPLGEGGKKALEAERNARKAAEQVAADFKKRLDEIEAANLSDLEKAQKQAQEAQEAATKATADAARFRIAAKHGISDEDADLFLHGTDAETLERQAAALVARTPNGPKPDHSQGAKGGAGTKTTADSFAEFFHNNLPER